MNRTQAGFPKKGGVPENYLKGMVDATGIEPVTPSV